MRILFVCSANISRSPLAEHYLRHLAGILGAPRLEPLSAGTLGIEGHPPDPVMVRIAARAGFDLSGHRSRALTAGLLHQADEVYVMERRHRAFIREHFPEALSKTEMLGVHLPGAGRQEIGDPTGGRPEGYERVAAQIFEAVERLAIGLHYPR